MSEFKLSRRSAIAGVGFVFAAGATATMMAPSAIADQGNMDAAMRQLGNALESLRRATPNKGGHRERAMALIEQAMAETQAGIDYAE